MASYFNCMPQFSAVKAYPDLRKVVVTSCPTGATHCDGVFLQTEGGLLELTATLAQNDPLKLKLQDISRFLAINSPFQSSLPLYERFFVPEVQAIQLKEELKNEVNAGFDAFLERPSQPLSDSQRKTLNNRRTRALNIIERGQLYITHLPQAGLQIGIEA